MADDLSGAAGGLCLSLHVYPLQEQREKKKRASDREFVLTLRAIWPQLTSPEQFMTKHTWTTVTVMGGIMDTNVSPPHYAPFVSPSPLLIPLSLHLFLLLLFVSIWDAFLYDVLAHSSLKWVIWDKLFSESFQSFFYVCVIKAPPLFSRSSSSPPLAVFFAILIPPIFTLPPHTWRLLVLFFFSSPTCSVLSSFLFHTPLFFSLSCVEFRESFRASPQDRINKM